MERDRLIATALEEVGYHEKASNSNLDSKTDNSGSRNYTKYARDLDNLGDFYNGKKNGYDWCDVFVDWCFFHTFGKERALELTCQPLKSTGAGCGFSKNFYKNKGQFYKNAEVGDQIFFGDSSATYHTGIVYKVENGKVYTIEGNKGNKVSLEEYSENSSKIAGYGRPNYKDDGKPSTPIEVEEKKDVLEWQKTMNKVYGCGLVEDNMYGRDCRAKANRYYLYYRNPMKSNQHVKFIQYRLIHKGFDCGKWGADGNYGICTANAVKSFQKSVGIKVDACCGADTTYHLLK